MEERISGTTRLCDPAPRESELGFWEALRATARVHHHGSSSLQVRRRGVPSDSWSASATTHRQHRGHSTGRDQYICIISVRISRFDLLCSYEYCCLCIATVHVD